MVLGFPRSGLSGTNSRTLSVSQDLLEDLNVAPQDLQFIPIILLERGLDGRGPDRELISVLLAHLHGQRTFSPAHVGLSVA